MLQLPYSRELEAEADSVGLMLAARVSYIYIQIIVRNKIYSDILIQACFDVRCAVAFWARMDKNDKDEKVPEFLSTHPANQARAVGLEILMPQVDEIKRFNLKIF